MPVTAIADIINPEVLADQVAAKFPNKLALGNTGLVAVNTTFPLGSPGTHFTIPFWKRMTGFADMTEGVALVPNKVSAAKEQAIVQRGGGAWEVYDTAQLVSIPNPVEEISNQLSEVSAIYVDDALLAAANNTPNTLDASGTTYNTAGTMELDVLTDALIGKMGDNYANLIANGMIVMHSKVYGDLLKLGYIQNQYQSGMNLVSQGLVPTLLGLPIHVSDRATTAVVSTVTYYTTFVVGPGALGLFYQRNVNVEMDRDILLKADVISADVHFASHLFGWDDVTDTIAAEDAKTIRVVAIKTK